ncbi:MAG: CAP domain-containing protein [Kiloniellales bacterium]|nr:CAP domain-containing protein [Kiloniellales bacterium]
MMRFVLVAAALLFALVDAGPSPAWADPAMVERMIGRLNHHRSLHGLPALRAHPKLSAAAQAHAEAMRDEACFAHTCPNGPDLSERLRRAGYRFRVASENIAAGFERPEEVVDVWMRSDSHRRNILDPEVLEAGAGYAFIERRRDRQELGHYWSLALGARRPAQGD